MAPTLPGRELSLIVLDSKFKFWVRRDSPLSCASPCERSRTGRRAFWAGFTTSLLLWAVTTVRQQNFGTSRWGLLMIVMAGVRSLR